MKWLSAIVLILGIAVLATPAAWAENACSGLNVASSPAASYADSTVPFTVSVENANPISVSLTLQAKFGWEPQPHSWGTMVLAAGKTGNNTFSKVMSDSPGDYGVQITLALQGAPAQNSTQCPAVFQNLRVSPMPPAPQVIAAVNVTHGASPLSVGFESSPFGGLDPSRFEWRFGDGVLSASAHTNHTFVGAGQYTVQLTRTDAFGRMAVDRFSIFVDAPPNSAQGNPQGGPAALLLPVNLLVALAALPVVALIGSHAMLARKIARHPRQGDGPERPTRTAKTPIAESLPREVQGCAAPLAASPSADARQAAPVVAVDASGGLGPADSFVAGPAADPSAVDGEGEAPETPGAGE